MKTILSVIQVLSLPLLFMSAIAYFIALREYKELLVQELPEIWKAERAKARPLESWMPTAYKLLQRTKDGIIDGQHVSAVVQTSRARTVKLLYTAAASFMVLLFSSLILEAIV